MKLRLLAVAAVVALQLSAQSNAAKPARVLLQSGVYQLTETNLIELSKPLTGESRDRVVRVFAFARPLTELEWANWSARGAVNHGYLPLNAYLVEIPVNARSAWAFVAELPLQGAAPFSGSMKLSNTLANGEFPEYAWVGSEVELVVVPLATASRTALSANLDRIGTVVATGAHGISVRINPSDLQRVAALPEVQFVQPKEAPGEPENLIGTKNHRATAIRVPFPG